MDGVTEEAVRRVGRAGGPGAPLAAEIARREAVAPRGEACDPPEIPGARELGEREEARSPVEERPVGGEEKRGERLLLDRGALPAAAVEPQRAPLRGEVGREEAWSPIPPEEEWCVVGEAQPAAASTAARYPVRSASPTRLRPVAATIAVGMERTPSAMAASKSLCTASRPIPEA